jgi:uncharacterized damage-inducible protein DinB
MEHDPYEEHRSLPTFNPKSIEHRLYHIAAACHGWLDKNHPQQAELRQRINDILQEYEHSIINAHKERN